jgi:hypothetical protein
MKEIGWKGWELNMAIDTVKWWALVSKILNFRVT